jgi:hypothetical protein
MGPALLESFVLWDKVNGLIRAPGVEIRGLSHTVMGGVRRREEQVSIATHHFRPYLEEEREYDPSALNPLLQCASIAIENKRSRKQNRKFEILHLTSTPGSDEAFKTMDHFKRGFGVNFEVRWYSVVSGLILLIANLYAHFSIQYF